MFTYQIEHRFNNVPVANLSDLDQSDENSKFHLDIPDWHRWIDNPSREHHWSWSGHHHCLTGDSGDCSRVLPVTRRRLSVRERHRARHCHRSLACHFHGEAPGDSCTLSPCNLFNHCSGASRRCEREEDSRIPGKQKQNTHKKSLRVTDIHSAEFRWVGSVWAVGGSRLTELTDLRCVHKAVCMCVSRSPGCASPCRCCCHRHVAAPCLRLHSTRLRWLRWWSWMWRLNTAGCLPARPPVLSTWRRGSANRLWQQSSAAWVL